MTDLIQHSPNSPILLTASLHVDEARKAISNLVNELIEESHKLNNVSDIESVTLDQAINRILAEDSSRQLMFLLLITLPWMALLFMVIAWAIVKMSSP
mgnify:CR=1 FL=1